MIEGGKEKGSRQTGKKKKLFSCLRGASQNLPGKDFCVPFYVLAKVQTERSDIPLSPPPSINVRAHGSRQTDRW
jgi:hypothetical protein